MNTKAANKPFFSIVLPTKDRSFLVKDLVNSVINQDFKDFELIVSDNSEGRDCIIGIKERNLVLLQLYKRKQI